MKTYKCLSCGEECLSSRQKTNKYCNNKCQQDHQYKQYIKMWLLDEITGTKTSGASKHVKRHILEIQDGKCNKCKLSEWNGLPITLELEHIDGNSTNNHISNLICLCPNCHSQTSTYKGKNKGNGRHSRRQRYAEGKSF